MEVRGLKLKTILLLLLGLCPALLCELAAQQTMAKTGAVTGVVFLRVPDEPAYVAGVTVVLLGDTMISSTVTDQKGVFSFPNLLSGDYTVDAACFGLHATQKITVEAGAAVQVALELKLPDSATLPKP